MPIMDISPGDKSYRIIIKNGIRRDAGILLREYHKGHRIFVLTDSKVGDLYLQSLEESLQMRGFSVYALTVPPGEESKSLETFGKVCNEFCQQNISREDLILALGGGVVGDLAGFVAACIHRGMDYVSLPTSLLAQVDSSVGGKTAINLPAGKNLIGAFHQPKMVLVDPEYLETLPQKFIGDGMGEVIKYGMIQDVSLLELLEHHNPTSIAGEMTDIIHRCLQIKKNLVEQDEKDKGLRMLLNFGHTIGHGIEAYFDYREYTHGQAVGLGMLMVVDYQVRRGLLDKDVYLRLENLLNRYHLPVSIPMMQRERLLDIVLKDKKFTQGNARVVLLKKVGEAKVATLSQEQLKELCTGVEEGKDDR